MEQFNIMNENKKDYTLYATCQFFNVSLTFIFICLFLLVVGLITGSNITEIFGYIVFGLVLLIPVLIIPALVVSILISSLVVKFQLNRNKIDILKSLFITFCVYLLAGIIVNISIMIISKNKDSINDFLVIFFLFECPIALFGCLSSLIFSYFLPK